MDASPWSRCTHQRRNGEFCDYPIAPKCPVTLCELHVAAVYDYARELVVIQQRVAGESQRLNHFAVWLEQKNAIAERIKAEGDPEVSPDESCSVYYLRCNGLIKIGFTTNLMSRFQSYPPTTTFLAWEPGGRIIESRRHKQFGPLLAAGREWFNESDELLAHIEQCKLKWPLPVFLMPRHEAG